MACLFGLMTSTASADFGWGMKVYPDKHSAASDYSESRETVGADHTWIQSALAAMEAYCKRVTGKEVSLSANYFLYRRMSRLIKEFEKEPRSDVLNSLNLGNATLGLNSDTEEGMQELVNEFSKGAILTQQEFQPTQPIHRELHKAMPTIVDDSVQEFLKRNPSIAKKDLLRADSAETERLHQHLRKQIPEKACTTLECLAQAALQRPEARAAAAQDSATNLKSTSADLLECLKKPVRIGGYTFSSDETETRRQNKLFFGRNFFIGPQEMLVHHINAGIPVWCRSRYNRVNRDFNIIAYEFHPETKTVSFTARHPNGKNTFETNEKNLDCIQVYWIEPQE